MDDNFCSEYWLNLFVYIYSVVFAAPDAVAFRPKKNIVVLPSRP